LEEGRHDEPFIAKEAVQRSVDRVHNKQKLILARKSAARAVRGSPRRRYAE